MSETKNVYIMGAGRFGKYVYDQLMLYDEDWHVLGYIDSDINKKGIEKDGLKVYHLLESQINIIEGSAIVLIAITDKYAKRNLMYQLNNIGFIHIYEVQDSAFFNHKNIVDASGLIMQNVKKYKIGKEGKILPVFAYIETHVIDSCNLKCKGCSHFSNLFCMDSVVDFEQFKNDILRLGEICDIKTFRILGGEPLLNKRLLEYLVIVRKTFPNADLKIATNGMLITKCSKELLEYISANNIIFSVTMYKPSLDIKEEITKLLDSYHISYSLMKENINEFNKVLTINGNNNPERSIATCIRKKCLILKQGGLYRCPISAYVSKYNERYGVKIESEVLFNIYTDSIERLWEIALENPTKPVSTCKHCVEIPTYFAWEQSFNPKMEEWLV